MFVEVCLVDDDRRVGDSVDVVFRILCPSDCASVGTISIETQSWVSLNFLLNYSRRGWVDHRLDVLYDL